MVDRSENYLQFLRCLLDAALVVLLLSLNLSFWDHLWPLPFLSFYLDTQPINVPILESVKPLNK